CAQCLPTARGTGRLRESARAPSRSPPTGVTTPPPRGYAPARGLLSPLQRPPHQGLVDAIGGKAEQGHREHHREHGVIDAASAEISDQVAEAALRYDQLGAHQ